MGRERCNSGGSWIRGYTRKRAGSWLRLRPHRSQSKRNTHWRFLTIRILEVAICDLKSSALSESGRRALRLSLFVFVARMEGSNPDVRVGALGKIFVALQPNGNPDLRLG